MEPLEKIHFINLEMLKEFDRVCRENGLHYYLFAGTLLGAVRHQDFIPWDDDVDVMMPREDVDRLISLRENFREGFSLWVPEEQGFFYDMIPRVLYETSQMRTPGEEDLFYQNANNKISIDIFAMDNACMGTRFKLQVFGLKMSYGLLMGHRYRVDLNKYKGIQKAQAAILSRLGKRISVKRLYSLYNKIARMGNKRDTEYIFNSTNKLCLLYRVFPRKDFEGDEYLPLHGNLFSVPCDFHGVLGINFTGNYMKLPGSKRRKPGHARLEEVKITYEGIEL